MNPQQLAEALAQIAQRDLMMAPVDLAAMGPSDSWVAFEGGAIVGFAGRVPTPRGLRVDVRVHPKWRRLGVGSALLETLSAGGDQPLLASCDAGHPRARRFVERRGFVFKGIVFFQRWDGVVADVPGAFRTADLRPLQDPQRALKVLTEAAAGSWPPPVVDVAQLADPAQYTQVAWLDDRPVGLVTARRVDDAWIAGGFAVLPKYRKRGVGRCLLANLMRAGAKEGLGVVLRVHHEAEMVQRWTAALGFWTYRSWAHYLRPIPRLHPVDRSL